MRKIFSLFTAILFAASMMADSYTITFKDGGTGSDKTSTLTSTTVSDYVDAGAEYVSAIAPTGKVYLAKTGAGLKFGNSSSGGSVTLTLATPIKPTSIVISASQFGASEGSGLFQGKTFDMTGGGGKYAFNDYTVTYDGETEVATISVGTAKRGYVNSITVNYASQGGEEQEGTIKTVYCKVTQDWWTTDGAATGIYAYADGNVENAAWPGVRMEAVEGEEGLWKADIDTAVYHNIIFTRFNPNDCDTEGCLDYGAKTGDLAIPADKDLYTITSTAAVWGDPGVEGEWSVYVAPVPVENVTIYCVNTSEWETVNAFVWPETGNAYEEWPGEAMTKTENQIHGFDVYAYTFPENYVNIIFNNGEEQTADLTWNTAKPYFVPGDKNGEGKFDGTWYATMEEIPAPAVPVEGNIWKAIGTTPVLAGSHYIDEDLIKMDGVYATTLKANARTIAGEEFTHAIQVRTDGYPSATNVIGAEKSGSTPLIITAKENIEVTFYYNRQVVGEGGTCNDNKDLIVFDQAAPTVKMEGDFVIDQILEGNSYLNATKKVMLEKDHVYTVTASGTTIQLHGVKFGIPVPAKFYITGDSALVVNAGLDKEQAWNPAAIKSEVVSYKLNLEAGDYMLTITLDGTWGEGKVLGYDAMTTKKDGLTRGEGQADDNICFTLTEAGEVSVHYDGEFFFLSGNFYVAPVEVHYYFKNNWGGEEWTWKEITNEEGYYMLGPVAVGGEGVNFHTAMTDDAPFITWAEISAFDASYEPAVIGAGDTVLFFFDPEEVNTYTGANGLSAQITYKYVAPEEPVYRLENGYYLFGSAQEWDVANLTAEDKFAVNLNSDVEEYVLTATLAENQEFKVVYVENDAIKTYYPDGTDNDYEVDAAHAGVTDIYFRPNYNGSEDWHNNCIYVLPTSGTAIDKVAGEAKAVKILKNGMLIIEKNGVKYNVLGVRL